MIDQKQPNNQLPKELKFAFDELEILKLLREAGIKKSFGFTCSYLFQLIFSILFHYKNWYALFHSKKAERFPAKDAVYRLLNHSTFALSIAKDPKQKS